MEKSCVLTYRDKLGNNVQSMIIKNLKDVSIGDMTGFTEFVYLKEKDIALYHLIIPSCDIISIKIKEVK